jgi:hypothetical protein
VAWAKLVANPANSRTALAAFITAAKKELLIYDPKVSDPAMLRLLQERMNAGVKEAAKPEKGSRRKCRGWHPRRMSRRTGMNLHPKLILALTARVLLLTTCAAGLAQRQSEPAGVQDDTRIVADFGSRVAKYIDLRKKAGDSPKPTKEPAKLAESRKQIADKVVTERADAKQGEVFTPEIAAYFKRQIAATFAGSEGAKIRASLRRAEPVHGVALKVNGAYPQGVPLQSTPPTVLLNLPRLPKELEYRIVGHDFALHDTVTNLIVDFIPDAIPASQNR